MAENFLDGKPILVTDESVDTVIRKKVDEYRQQGKDDAFYVVDLDDVIAKYERWQRCLPRVEAFYAIKCNHDPVVMATLTKLGAGYDCATKGEIERALHLDVPPRLIAYANPCKQISHLVWARQNNIKVVMFDNEPELHKTKKYYPDAELVIRIKPDLEPYIPNRLPLGKKFGLPLENTRQLLSVAKDLELNVVGVSFHVGTSDYSPTFFTDCIEQARAAFDIGQELGFNFTLLDIGGGFTGLVEDVPYTFEMMADAIRPCLDHLFPTSSGVRIIAEPGRYFVDSSFTIVCNVIAKRLLFDNEMLTAQGVMDTESPRHMYYISCGVFHSFLGRTKTTTASIREVDVYNPEKFEGRPRNPCVLWGPSMAPGDCMVNGERPLPELDTDDWVVFRDMGDYSICQFSHFGSLGFPEHVYKISTKQWKMLNAE